MAISLGSQILEIISLKKNSCLVFSCSFRIHDQATNKNDQNLQNFGIWPFCTVFYINLMKILKLVNETVKILRSIMYHLRGFVKRYLT